MKRRKTRTVRRMSVWRCIMALMTSMSATGIQTSWKTLRNSMSAWSTKLHLKSNSGKKKGQRNMGGKARCGLDKACKIQRGLFKLVDVIVVPPLELLDVIVIPLFIAFPLQMFFHPTRSPCQNVGEMACWRTDAASHQPA